MSSYLGLPELASVHGADVDFLILLIHGLMILLGVGWSVYFVYVLIRFRSSRSRKASYTGTKTRAGTYVEGGVVVAEAVLLVGFSIPLWAERVAVFPDEEEAVVVRVVGEQFIWNVHYPGPDGVFGRTDVKLMDLQTNPLGLDRSDPAARDDIVVINHLHLPVDRPAIIHLSSKDVIHTFGVPEIRLKQQAIPGLTIPVWFVPTVTTEQMRQIKGQPDFTYEIACAQLCGIGHYRMRGFMTVHSQEGFEAWLEAQARDPDEDDDDFWN